LGVFTLDLPCADCFRYSFLLEKRCQCEKSIYEYLYERIPQRRKQDRRIGKSAGNRRHEAGSGEKRKANDKGLDRCAVTVRRAT
jgi:hypothetical protein